MKVVPHLKRIKSEDGRTLIEIVASLAILAIIIIPFTTLFVQSGKNINKSEEMMDATYIAQSVMEEVIYASKKIDFDLTQIMNEITGESKHCMNAKTCNFIRDGYFVELFFEKKEPSNELVNILVKVYPDETKEILDAQMETFISWGSQS